MSENNTYTPRPVFLKEHGLSEEALDALAHNIHEVWAEGRIQDGWKYGPERNDENKETPCLVPYDELTEEEKAYDRNTAIATVSALLSLGIKLSK